MSLLAAAAVCTAGILAALLPGLRRKASAYRATSRIAMAAQHHAPELLVQRVPGQTAAAYGPIPTHDDTDAWETDDVIPAADVWCAWYPPGSLGDYPEQLPSGPGLLAGGPRDIEDLLTGAIRHLRETAR